ncbi:AI-2E family transporter [Sphingobacterium sp. LRF_L2]|uniref:AI-2E family transporter n=1 Tax=Sphingobacterium sp. LRF_L2 TaxID=3369421 RepID=UPI003F629660
MNLLPSDDNNFVSKVWTTVGIAAFVSVLLLLFWKAVQVFLYILAGAIIATYFHGFAGMIARKFNLSKKWSLGISILTTFAFLGAVFFFIGSRISNEAAQFSEKLPALIEDASAYIQKNNTLKTAYDEIKSAEMLQKASPIVGSFFNSTFGFLGNLYVVLFIGLFFTVSPEQYKKGLVKLLPGRARKQGTKIVNLTADNLKSWLKGMLFSMLVVFVLTSIGLVLLGIDLWLILALIAGLLSFIPNFGPIMAIIPAALVALSQSPIMAVWVIGLYCLVQLLESNFITPLVQQELINTPPALLIIVQVFMGIWLGGWGVILATPILVICMVLIEQLYTKKQDEIEKNTSC